MKNKKQSICSKITIWFGSLYPPSGLVWFSLSTYGWVCFSLSYIWFGLVLSFLVLVWLSSIWFGLVLSIPLLVWFGSLQAFHALVLYYDW